MRHPSRKPLPCSHFLLLPLLLILFLASGGTAATGDAWQTLEPGLEIARFTFPGAVSGRDSVIVAVRIDPGHWALETASLSEEGMATGLSVREWAARKGYRIVVNAGLFQSDLRTHVGLMISPTHMHNPQTHPSYQAALGFLPKLPGLVAWKTFDLDEVPLDEVRKQYSGVIQNLRLIKHPGENRWSGSGRSWWSEIALGEDRKGRILLLYTPAVVTMYDFNQALLALPLDLVSAQHLEGGLQAQLYLDVGGQKIEFHTGHETDFTRSPLPGPGMKIPNVIGFRQRR